MFRWLRPDPDPNQIRIRDFSRIGSKVFQEPDPGPTKTPGIRSDHNIRIRFRLHDYYRFNVSELVSEGVLNVEGTRHQTNGDLSVWDAFKIGEFTTKG